MQGAAWLSSARAVRCWVKSRNERNPCPMLPASNVGDSWGTAGDKPEEGGDDVKSSWPLRLGYTRATMANTKGCQPAKVSESQKVGLSSDCSLQLDCMKSESLVIVDQNATVNTFPGLVHTARHAMEAGSARSP